MHKTGCWGPRRHSTIAHGGPAQKSESHQGTVQTGRHSANGADGSGGGAAAWSRCEAVSSEGGGHSNAMEDRPGVQARGRTEELRNSWKVYQPQPPGSFRADCGEARARGRGIGQEWLGGGRCPAEVCFGLGSPGAPGRQTVFRPVPQAENLFSALVVKSKSNLCPTSKVKFLHLTRKLYQPGRKKRFRPGLVAISAWSTRPNPLIEFAGGKNKAKKAP